MLDPLTTPLLVVVLGNLAHEIIADVCKDHLKSKLKSFFGWLEKLSQRDKCSQRMRTKFSPVDLANLMPAYAKDPGQMIIRDWFALTFAQQPQRAGQQIEQVVDSVEQWKPVRLWTRVGLNSFHVY